MDLSSAVNMFEMLGVAASTAESSNEILGFLRRITTRGKIPNLKRSKRAELRSAWICLNHRSVLYKELYEASFESRGEVLYASIMSEHSLENMKKHLERAAATKTRLKILTWDPKVGRDAVEAFRKHLDEEKDSEKQVANALQQWTRLAMDFPKAIREVRKFTSSPTMQGIIVKGAWAVLELLPYGIHPQDRPALLLDAARNRDLYEAFCEPIEKLFSQSELVIDNRKSRASKKSNPEDSPLDGRNLPQQLVTPGRSQPTARITR